MIIPALKDQVYVFRFWLIKTRFFSILTIYVRVIDKLIFTINGPVN